VSLVKSGAQVIGTVRDYGKGIKDDVTQGRPDRIGVGIGGMKQRVKEFGGEFRIENANPGTSVEVTIPIEPLAGDSEEGIGGLARPAHREVAL
jgi:signal transduction histidine kinase